MSRVRVDPHELLEIDRATLEKVAHICGPQSAAALALADADAHPGPVRFWKTGSSIVVEKFPVEEPPTTKEPAGE